MSATRTISIGIYKIAMVETFLFGGLLVAAFLKGLIQALWNGHTFMDSLVGGALFPIWIPCILLCIHLVFVVTFPGILKLASLIVVLPFLMYFIVFVTFPSAGHPTTSFTSLPLVEQTKVLASDAERNLALAEANPSSKEADWVRRWESTTGETYREHIANLHKEAADFKAQKAKDRESIPPALRWFWDLTN